jgi:hypothetical protein
VIAPSAIPRPPTLPRAKCVEFIGLPFAEYDHPLLVAEARDVGGLAV